ncbi:membrane-spanning 4-domains subfamily A member 4D [Lates calcarifer]|uniref:Membrane-spanning 4-domains subfamily A member 4D n=1 Tax=Lates calcarifer TaxID=8187 RepID=A0AAJ8DLT3_LATCA|nr:membrane-spanning 4-domains subfamily A member 4D [Lates calcarifer]
MSSSVSTTVGGVVVVTHVHPTPQGAMPQLPVGIQKFSRASPMALGTVQIMIGLITLLFGIVMVIHADTLGDFSGVFVWGALIYIIAGSLTVAAGKSPNRYQVNLILLFSVVTAVASSVATILCSLDAAGVVIPCHDYACPLYQTQTKGFSGVLAVFHVLAFVVSITVAAFCCNATCNCCQQAPSYVVVPVNASVTAQALPSAPPYTDTDPHLEPRYPWPPPPPYTTVVN